MSIFQNLPQPKGFNDDLLRIAAAKGFRMMEASQSRMQREIRIPISRHFARIVAR